jgi:hypothetical protein
MHSYCLTYVKTGIIFLALLTTFLPVGCKDKCSEEERKRILEGITTAIPYQDGQTIRYKTNTSDSFNVSVKRIYEEGTPENNCEEYLEVKLTDPLKPAYFFAETVVRGLSVDSMIQISVSPTRENGKGTTVQFYLTKDKKLAGFNRSEYQATFLNTATIDGKTYNNVLKLDYNAPPQPESILQFFYNQTEGIIQVRTKSGLVVTKK